DRLARVEGDAADSRRPSERIEARAFERQAPTLVPHHEGEEDAGSSDGTSHRTIPPSAVLGGERRPIDPNLPADHPLEPGAARVRPGVSAAERIAASEATLGSAKPAEGADAKANFIAAARRAAQAAASLS